MPVTATPVSGRSSPPDGEAGTVADSEGDAEPDGTGDSDADGEPDGDSEADGDSDGCGDSEVDGDGDGEGDFVGASPAQVWLTLNLVPVPLTVADPPTSVHPAGVNR